MDPWELRLAKQTFWSAGDLALFRKFAQDASTLQISPRRIDKYRTDLTIAHTMTKMGISEMVRSVATLKEAMARINASQEEYAFESKHDCKRTLGSLFCFVHYKDRSTTAAPRDVRKLFAHHATGKDVRLARPVITREEIRELCKHSKDTQDKAMLWLLFESGMRNGEFEQLKKSDITPCEEGLIVKVPAGKTGEREVIVVEATKYVNDWLEAHPVKNKDAPLWYYVQKNLPNAPTKGRFTQAGIAKRIRGMEASLNRYRSAQGIPLFEKDTNPHNFRHSRASELGGEPGMTEAIMCKIFGWTIGSDMPRTYLHLTNEQVRRAVLRTYGRAKEEEQKAIVTSWTCPRCKENTPIGSNYCARCGSQRDGKVINKTALLEIEVKEMRKEQERMRKEMERMRALAAEGTVGLAKREVEKRAAGNEKNKKNEKM